MWGTHRWGTVLWQLCAVGYEDLGGGHSLRYLKTGENWINRCVFANSWQADKALRTRSTTQQAKRNRLDRCGCIC